MALKKLMKAVILMEEDKTGGYRKYLKSSVFRCMIAHEIDSTFVFCLVF